MSEDNTRLTPQVYREFTAAVERTTKETLKENPQLAGGIFVVLFFLLQGAMEINDVGGGAVAGP